MKQVLIIEDDRWLADIQKHHLEGAGFEVKVAHEAFTAIDHIDSSKPDLIVADVLLAGSTIFALLHELRSYPDTTGIPVVLCTNLADGISGTDLQEYNVKRVVDKTTMEPADLVAAVKACL